MHSIKNIIFDLGGIFLQVDYQKTEDAFVALGISNFASYYKQDFVSKLFEDFETGLITPADFCNGFRQITNAHLTNEQIETAWNAMLGDFWAERLVWLEMIGKQYNVYLFSNTNETHYHALMEIYHQSNPGHDLSNYFIKDYYSHTLGMRKPYKESYVRLLNEHGLQAQETLFIDDTLKNIEGAKEAGLQTLLLLPTMDLEKEVTAYLKKE